MQKNIEIELLEPNCGQIEGLPANPRKWSAKEVNKLAKSLIETPELFAARPLLVVPHGEKYIIIGGNLRFDAAKKNKEKEVPCYVYPKDTPVEKLKEIAIKDNGSFGEWDYDLLGTSWAELPLEEWGVIGWGESVEVEENDYENKQREFEERMAAGEDLETDEEYNEWLEKFEAKRTTDDCYTPSEIYDVICDYVENKYNVSRKNFVRPFYPNGNYQKEKYKATDIVVDNPPFSIFSEIIGWYAKNKIKFFLFAPHTSSLRQCLFDGVTVLAIACSITYENGAIVNTSFVTNLGDGSIAIETDPELWQMVFEENKKLLAKQHKQLPKYKYPDNLFTLAMGNYMSQWGQKFSIAKSEALFVDKLDAQKEAGKCIFGGGLLISEKAAAEKAAAEKAAAEKAAAEKAAAAVWELSERELKIIEELNKKGENK